MKKTLNIIFATLLLVCGGCGFALGEERLPEKILVGGLSTISAPPYGWIDKCNGEPVGSARRLLQRVFGDLGVTVEFVKPMPVGSPEARRVMSDLHHGKLDAVTSVLRAQTTDGVIMTTQPMFSINRGVAYRRDQLQPIKKIQDLSGRKGVVPSFSRRLMEPGQLDRLIQQYDLQLEEVGSSDSGLMKVLHGEAEYSVVGRYREKTIAMSKNIDQLLVYQELPEFAKTAFLAFQDGSVWHRHLADIDALIKHYTDNGYVDYLEKSYLLVWQQGGCLNTSAQLPSATNSAN